MQNSNRNKEENGLNPKFVSDGGELLEFMNLPHTGLEATRDHRRRPRFPEVRANAEVRQVCPEAAWNVRFAPDAAIRKGA